MDLQPSVETISILNIDNDLSSISATEVIANKGQQNYSNNKYILSDVDEELLILIKFKEYVSLKSIKINASNDIDIDDDHDVSPPKQIHIYKLKSSSISFHDVDSLHSDKSIKCNPKKLKKGQLIKLQKESKLAVTFKRIQHLCIYIKSNQRDTEKTYLNSITLIGDGITSKFEPNIKPKTERDPVPMQVVKYIQQNCICDEVPSFII